MQNNKLVSVIIPIYNVEKYIRKCVDSIIRQTYKNIEILLVDDSSPDQCPLICDEYAKKDQRITVIHKNNGGLSDARNAGLKIAKGEYVAFVDADDYVDDNFIEILLNTAIKENADISVCSYYKVYKHKIVAPTKSISSTVLNNIEAMRDIFTIPSLCEVMAWNKLYKRDLFTHNNILFPIGKIHEDNFTTYKLFYYSNSIVFTNQPLYYYVQREGSIMGSKFNKRSLDMIEASHLAVKWVNDKKIPLLNEVSAYKLSIYINLLNVMIDNSEITQDTWKDISQWILINKIELLDNNHINHKQKLAIKILGLGRLPYTTFRMIYKITKLKRG